MSRRELLLPIVLAWLLLASSIAAGIVSGFAISHVLAAAPGAAVESADSGFAIGAGTRANPRRQPEAPIPVVVSPAAPTPTPTTSPVGSRRSQHGVASWGWFGGHVVTRLARGTRIRVCGAGGCWTGHSWGYGPARWTRRLVDLDDQLFVRLCGLPLARGLCVVRLWTL